MALNGYFVEPIEYKTTRPFVEQWHYSHSTNGLKLYQCFGLFRPNEKTNIPELVGAAIFGEPAMTHQSSSWNISNPKACIELRRLCCIDDTPRNAESFFIGKMIKWLKKNTDIEVILSYADPSFGHSGIIYKATNFEMVGMTSPGKILLVDGKRYHDRTLRMKKPYALKIVERIKNGDKTIQIINTPAKYIYLYRINR